MLKRAFACVYTTSFPGCRNYRTFLKKWCMSFTPSTSTAGSPIICDRMLSGSWGFWSDLYHKICGRVLFGSWRRITPSIIFNLSQHRRSSTLKKTLATSSGAHVLLAHMLKSFVDTHPLAAKRINIVWIWASDNLPIILLADLIQNAILVPMRASFSATLNVDPLAFTRTSSYCSTKHRLHIWGKQSWGHSKIWEKSGTTYSVFRARTRSWESACQFSWPLLSRD